MKETTTNKRKTLSLFLCLMAAFVFAGFIRLEVKAQDGSAVTNLVVTRANKYYHEYSGWLDEDDWYRYDLDWREGDQITISYKDGSEPAIYTCQYDDEYDYVFLRTDNDVIPASDFEIVDPQKEEHWNEPGKYAYKVKYSNQEYQQFIDVLAIPNISITYTPNPDPPLCIKQYTNNSGFWISSDGEAHYIYSYVPYNTGDELTITDAEGTSTTYTCTVVDDPEDGRVATFTSNDGDELDTEYLSNEDDQYETPWDTVGDHTFYITYFGVRSNPLTITLEPNDDQRKIIEYKPTITSCVEYTNGYNTTEYDDDDDEPHTWWRYRIKPHEGDEMILQNGDDQSNQQHFVFKDDDFEGYFEEDDAGGEKEKIYVEEESVFNIWSDQSWDKPWGKGNHTYRAFYGASYVEVPFRIKASNLKEIQFIPKDTTRAPYRMLENDSNHGDMNEDEDNPENSYFRYYVQEPFSEGDQLVVTDVLDNQDTYTYRWIHNEETGETTDAFVNNDDPDDTISSDEFDIDNNQDTVHWTPGGENFIFISYQGKTCSVPVVIEKNNVASISYVPVKQKVLLENTGGFWDSNWDDDGNITPYYHYNVFSEDGDRLIVTDKDNKSVTYTCQTDNTTWERNFVSEDGKVIKGDDVQFETERYPEPGPYQYTVKYAGQEAKATITIRKAPVSIDLQEKGTTVELKVGDRFMPTLTVTPEEYDMTGLGEWSYDTLSSGNNEVITLDKETGEITAVGPGTAQVYFSIPNSDYESMWFTVSVSNEMTGITILKDYYGDDISKATLTYYTDQQMTASVHPAPDDVGMSGFTCYWESDNEKVIINPSGENYENADISWNSEEGSEEGEQALITVTAIDNEDDTRTFTNNFTVVYKKKAEDGAYFNQNEVRVNRNAQETIALKDYMDNYEEDDNNPVTWTVEDETIATVDDAGIVTPLKNGTTTVSVSRNGKGNSTSLIVSEPVTSVSFDEKEVLVVGDEEKVLNCVVEPEDITDYQIDVPYDENANIWLSKNEDDSFTVGHNDLGKATITVSAYNTYNDRDPETNELKDPPTDQCSITVISEEMKELIDTVEGLPDTVGLDEAAAVKHAKETYDSLSDEHKELIAIVSPGIADKLTSAYVAVEAAKEAQHEEDQQKADEVSVLIGELHDAENVTINDKDAIDKAVQSYNGLSKSQKALIDPDKKTKLYDVKNALTDAEEEKQKADDQAAANEVIAAITSLPDVNNVTVNNKTAIEAADAAFAKLTDAQKALISDELKTKLSNAKIALAAAEKATDQKAADQKAANAVIAKINALPNPAGSANESAVKAARDAYDKLTADQKKLVSSALLQKLTNAEKQVKDAKAAEAAKKAAEEAAAKKAAEEAAKNPVTALGALNTPVVLKKGAAKPITVFVTAKDNSKITTDTATVKSAKPKIANVSAVKLVKGKLTFKAKGLRAGKSVVTAKVGAKSVKVIVIVQAKANSATNLAAKKSVTVKANKTAKVVVKVTSKNAKLFVTDLVTAKSSKAAIAGVTNIATAKGKVVVKVKGLKKGKSVLVVKVGKKAVKVNVIVK